MTATEIIARARARAVAEGRIATSGAACRTIEATAWRNRVADWHRRGRPAGERAELERAERHLRASGRL